MAPAAMSFIRSTEGPSIGSRRNTHAGITTIGLTMKLAWRRLGATISHSCRPVYNRQVTRFIMGIEPAQMLPQPDFMGYTCHQ